MPITTDRLADVAGPALLTLNGAHYVAQEDVTVDLVTETREIKVNGITRDFVVTDKRISVKCKPVSLFRDTGKTFPFATRLPGSLLFGADVPLLIQPYDTAQKQLTFATAAITAMPGLNFGVDADLFDGDMEITCYGKNGEDPGGDDYRFTEAVNTFDGDFYDPTKLIVQSYEVSHPGLNGGEPFDTEDGVKVDFNLSLTDRKNSSLGVYNKQFTAIAPVATLTPVGVPEADVRAALGMQGANSVRGQRLSALAGNLDIVADGVFFRLPMAAAKQGGTVYSTSKLRVGQLQFAGTGASGGAASPFFILDVAAPVVVP